MIRGGDCNKKRLAGILIGTGLMLVLLWGITLPAPAHAQPIDTGSSVGTGALDDPLGTRAPANPSPITLPNGTVITGQTSNGQQTVSQQDPNNPNATMDTTSSGNMDAGMGFMWNFVVQLLYIFLVAIPVYIASLAGILFNSTILYFVLGMGQIINVTTGIGTAINQLWVVIRDVMNILFIFGLIYIGLKTIWNAEDSNTRKTLGLLIAAALLINFSLFISKVVVDFTNLAAVEVCDLMNCRAGAASGIGSLQYSGISGSFFDATGVANLVTQAQVQAGTSAWDLAVKQALTMFMVFILFIVLTVIFVGGAVMIFTRFVALVLYMIFSPIMFLGWILPNFKSYQDRWWDGFFQKAFFAPLYLFMLYISLITVRQLRAGMPGTDGGNANYSGAIGNNGGDAFNIILVYAFTIGMLVASVVVAKQFSMVGSGMTLGALNGLKSRAYSIGRNAGSAIGRNTLGRIAAAEAQHIEANEATWGGRMRNRLTTAATLGAFDTQSRLKAAKGLKENKFGGSRSYASQETWGKERAALQATGDQKNQLKGAIDTFIQTDKSNASQADKDKARQAMERKVIDAPNSHIVEMAKSKGDREKLKNVVGELSDSQWKAIMDEKEINDDVKKELGIARGQQVEARLVRLNKKSDDDTIKNVIHKADTSELKALGFDKAMENAEFLSSKQVSEWKDLTPTEKAALKKKRKEDILERFNEEGPDTVFERFKTDEERAKLPEDILKSDEPEVLRVLNPKVLDKISKDEGIDSGVRDKIREHLERELAREAVTPGSSPLTEGQVNALKKYFDSPLGSQF